MDTQNLRAFQVVAERSSFSEAADVLHLTQPAVSKRIAVLEGQLNCRLFDRIGRKISLTEAGLALLPKAQRILQEVADAQGMIRDLSGEVGGSLSVVTSHHIGLHRLPNVIQQFSQQYPEVSLDLNFLDSEKAYEAILHGEFELAIITLAPTPHPKITSHNIWSDQLQFVVAPKHRLAQNSSTSLKESSTSLKELSAFPAILPTLNTYMGNLIKGLFDRRKLPLKLTIPTNYLETIKMMVSIELGWSVLPETMIDSQLVKLNINGLQLTRQLGCIYHKERSLSNAANAFLQVAIKSAVST